jgi:hypothetical protein
VAVELLGKELGVLSTDLEGQLAADVAEHGSHRGLVHLGQVSVGDGQRQAVLLHEGFAGHRSEQIGGGVLELVHVQVEIAALVLRNIGTTHGGQLQAGDQQRVQQRAGILADFALAELNRLHRDLKP